MQLSHVCMWSEHGWKRVTAKEAAKMHPGGTVSAKSGLFMCELCGQYVTLTDGWIRDRYFRHSAEELSKDCPERTFSNSVSITFPAGTYDLPLKIKIISSGKFKLFLGLLPVPNNLLDNKGNSKIVVGCPDSDTQYVYSFERLTNYCISYLSVGTKPYEKYNISVIPSDDRLNSYWPKTVEGVFAGGTIFDGITGKKLPYDADTLVNHRYYLLTKQNLYIEGLTGITAKSVCRCNIDLSTWNVYEIEATSFDERVARFFLNYHCRLTENEVDIIPLWPVYIETPYRIYHQYDKITIFLRGDAEPKVFPETSLYSESYNNGKVFSVNCKKRQQLLSAGRTKVLKYTYLWKDILDCEVSLPQIAVTDLSGTVMMQGEQSKLPEKRMLSIKAPFDGFVKRKKKGIVLEQFNLYSDKIMEIDEVQYNQTIEVTQGLDIVWSVTFVCPVVTNDSTDELLLYDLEKCSGEYISVTHSLGALAERMAEYPRSREWLYACIRTGKMSKKAYRLLTTHFTRQ